MKALKTISIGFLKLAPEPLERAMKINPRLETLPDYPFDRLRNLLEGINPPDDMTPISLAVGEPQQPVPSWVANIVHDQTHRWNNYPPFAGTPESKKSMPAPRVES